MNIVDMLNTLDEEYLEEMARIGYVDDLELIIWTDDKGNIPHFYLRDRSTKGSKFNTCIKLNEPEYFHHTGKEDILNSKQKKNLVMFLTQNFKDTNLTNWQYLIMSWNANNSSIVLPIDQEMPNYIELN